MEPASRPPLTDARRRAFADAWLATAHIDDDADVVRPRIGRRCHLEKRLEADPDEDEIAHLEPGSDDIEGHH
jgi:hypothetical protein